MVRVQRRRDAMEKSENMHCPKILKKLEKAKTFSFSCRTTWSGGNQYQVACGDGQFVVNINEKTCTCRRWQLTGIPCVHAISSIYYNHDRPENHINECYRVSKFLATYRHILNPTQGRDCWPRSQNCPMKPPEPAQQRRGRKTMLRRKEAGEDIGFRKGNVSRKGFKVTCSICGVVGHNKRFHGSKVLNLKASKGFNFFLIFFLICDVLCLTCILHRV